MKMRLSLFTIKNSNNQVIKKILEKPTKGYNRFHWDLRYEVTSPISFSSPSFYNPFSGREGTLVSQVPIILVWTI